MAPSTMAKPVRPVENPAPSSTSRWRHPVVPSLVSALLLWLSFPPAGCWFFSWIALAFLFSLVKSPRSRVSLYFGSWLGGFVFWLLSIQWVRLTDPSAWLAWVVMALFLSLWWPAFLYLGRVAVLSLKLPLMVAAPIIWVGLEYLRAHILTGFPWYYLAHSLYEISPLIQIADFAGSLGISWLVALVNAWWVGVFTLPLLRLTPNGPRLTRAQMLRGSIVLSLVGATLFYGFFRLGSANFRQGPVVALLQSNLEQRMKTDVEPREIELVYKQLIEKALGQNSSIDLIVWPETAYPYVGFGQISPKITAEAFEAQAKALLPADAQFWRERVAMLTKHLHDWTDAIKVPMLVGAALRDFHPDGYSRYNSAVLFEPGVATFQCYHKIHLVPFGEYVPLIDYFPWLTVLTPYNGTHVPSMTFGREPIWLTVGPYRIATAICFEDTVPHVVRRFFHEVPDGRQPDLLINLSNDGWFHGSEEHDMHLAVSVFRAVENRVPIARAVNTGISAIIDGNGSILKTVRKLREDVLIRAIPLDDRVTAYTAWGDWLGLSCLSITIGLTPLSWIKSRRRRPSPT